MSIQARFQTYNGFGIHSDGSAWQHHKRRLADGSSWNLYVWHPPR